MTVGRINNLMKCKPNISLRRIKKINIKSGMAVSKTKTFLFYVYIPLTIEDA